MQRQDATPAIPHLEHLPLYALKLTRGTIAMKNIASLEHE